MDITQAELEWMPLEDICLNYHGGDENSEEANASVQVSKARMRIAVLLCLKDFSPVGLTCQEIEQITGMSHQTCSARITELHRDGVIIRTGKRPTQSGRNAWVYEAA